MSCGIPPYSAVPFAKHLKWNKEFSQPATTFQQLAPGYTEPSPNPGNLKLYVYNYPVQSPKNFGQGWARYSASGEFYRNFW